MANIKGVTHQGEVVDLGSPGIAFQVDMDDQPAADRTIEGIKANWLDRQRVEQGVAYVAVDGHAVPVSATDTETHEEKAQRLLDEGAFPEPSVVTTAGPKPMSEVSPALNPSSATLRESPTIVSSTSNANSATSAAATGGIDPNAPVSSNVPASGEGNGEPEAKPDDEQPQIGGSEGESQNGAPPANTGPVDLSGLDANIVRLLAQGGVNDIEQLRSKSDADLLKIAGLKAANVRTIRAYLG